MRIDNGVVTKIASKNVTTKFGEKPTYSFQVNGAWFKHGFKRPSFKEGATISFDYEAGSYGNEVEIASVSVGAASAPPVTGAVAPVAAKPFFTGSKGVFPIPALDGQRAIVRQNALTNAREVVMNYRTKAIPEGDVKMMDEHVEEIIRVARRFEAYACGDLDAEAAIEEFQHGKH